MATNFDDAILSSNGFSPTKVDTPIDRRTRIEIISEVPNIPNPFVGMLFYVSSEDKYYRVKSLKSKVIGGITVQNAQVNEYVPFETGGSGTTNYSDLSNKPSIGGVTLEGNKTLDDLGIASKKSVEGKQDTIKQVNVTVDDATGTPSGSASVSGSTLNIDLKNIKGDTGATGPSNTITIGTVTPSDSPDEASATITGEAPNQVLNLVLPRGMQGNSGVSGDTSEIAVINDLNGGESEAGSIKVLAAEQGKVLNEKIKASKKEEYVNNNYLGNEFEAVNLFSNVSLVPTQIEENKLIRSNGLLETEREDYINAYNVAYFDVLQNKKYFISYPPGGQYYDIMFLALLDSSGNLIFSECNCINNSRQLFVFTAKQSGKLRICYRNNEELFVYQTVQINNKNFVWYDSQSEFDLKNIHGYKERAYQSIVDAKFYNCDPNEKRALYLVWNGRPTDGAFSIRISVLKNDSWEVEFNYSVNDVSTINPQGNAIFDVVIRNGVKKCVITFNSGYIAKADGGSIVDDIKNSPLLIFSKNCYVESGMWYKETDDIAFPNEGYISSSTNEVADSPSYKYSDFLQVNKGDIILTCMYGTYNVYAISLYDENKEFIQGFKPSLMLGNSEEANYNYYVVDNDKVRYMRSCTNLTKKTLSYIIISDRLPSKILDTISSNNDNNNEIKLKRNNYLLKKSRSSVNFIFDDGEANDELIKGVFDEKNAKCGFAIISANSRYNKYYNEGFEILAHGSTPLSTATEEEAKNAFVNGKKVVEDMGIPCYGWVTPSSQLNEELHSLVYDYFYYGFTTYKGATIEGQTQTKDLKSYDLWRIHISTLKDNLSIIDDAVSQNGVVSIYGHGYEIDDTWTLDDLRTVIDYVNERTEILIPYESYIKLFTVRHNE